jgi:hypothetical protein
MADKSKRKGKETGTSNKRSKLPIIGGKNKNRGIKITDRQPPVKGKENEVANRSKGKGKEKEYGTSNLFLLAHLSQTLKLFLTLVISTNYMFKHVIMYLNFIKTRSI